MITFHRLVTSKDIITQCSTLCCWSHRVSQLHQQKRFIKWASTRENGPYGFPVLRFFKSPCVVFYLGYRHAVFAWSFLRVSITCLHYENTSIEIYRQFFHPPKIENFQIKFFDIFVSSAQNIDCGYSLEPPHRGGSNKYPQSMFWAEIRKIMYTPVNPSFTI